jgi:K+-transporting ATPase ATPase C chain
MMRLWVAFKMTLVMTLITGIVYPIAMVVLAHVIFPAQAAGSLVSRDGRIIGSSLIGQNFAAVAYFHGRPSSAGDKGYDAANSSGSNSGPTNKSFIETVRGRLKSVRESELGAGQNPLPVDLVTASGSGLDPEITPASAALQTPRVARARGVGEDQVRALIRDHTRRRGLGILGEQGVNVLELNLALDRLKPAGASARVGN